MTGPDLSGDGLSSIINGSPVAMLLVDDHGRIIFANSRSEAMFGYAESELFYNTIDVLIPDKLKGRHAAHVSEYFRSPRPRPMGSGVNLIGRKKDGSEVPLEIGLSPITVGDTGYILVSIIDNSDRDEVKKLAETNRELQNAALHDALTGLPNRLLLDEFIEKARQFAVRNKKGIALIFVDLDGFKEVNDNHGHAIGDKLLCRVAGLLAGSIRESDIVGRLGGDEFLICVQQTDGEEALHHLAEKILNAVAGIGDIEGNPVAISASIGVMHCAQPDAVTTGGLIEMADQLMYRAKKAGKNRIVIDSTPSTA